MGRGKKRQRLKPEVQYIFSPLQLLPLLMSLCIEAIFLKTSAALPRISCRHNQSLATLVLPTFSFSHSSYKHPYEKYIEQEKERTDKQKQDRSIP